MTGGLHDLADIVVDEKGVPRDLFLDGQHLYVNKVEVVYEHASVRYLRLELYVDAVRERRETEEERAKRTGATARETVDRHEG